MAHLHWPNPPPRHVFPLSGNVLATRRWLLDTTIKASAGPAAYRGMKGGHSRQLARPPCKRTFAPAPALLLGGGESSGGVPQESIQRLQQAVPLNTAYGLGRGWVRLGPLCSVDPSLPLATGKFFRREQRAVLGRRLRPPRLRLSRQPSVCSGCVYEAVKRGWRGAHGPAPGLRRSRLEHVHGPDDVLATDGALAHALAALGAGDHVPALQQHTVDGGVHADAAQVVVLVGQRRLLPCCCGEAGARVRARPWAGEQSSRPLQSHCTAVAPQPIPGSPRSCGDQPGEPHNTPTLQGIGLWPEWRVAIKEPLREGEGKHARCARPPSPPPLAPRKEGAAPLTYAACGWPPSPCTAGSLSPPAPIFRSTLSS